MRNRDKPAVDFGGLTKREAAAIAAMQGILANGELLAELGRVAKKEGLTSEGVFAEFAVGHADALFDELEKGDG